MGTLFSNKATSRWRRQSLLSHFSLSLHALLHSLTVALALGLAGVRQAMRVSRSRALLLSFVLWIGQVPSPSPPWNKSSATKKAV